MKTLFKEKCGSCERTIQPGEEIIHEYSKHTGESISAYQAHQMHATEFRCESICSDCQNPNSPKKHL